jgi:hypothetical protein
MQESSSYSMMQESSSYEARDLILWCKVLILWCTSPYLLLPETFMCDTITLLVYHFVICCPFLWEGDITFQCKGPHFLQQDPHLLTQDTPSSNKRTIIFTRINRLLRFFKCKKPCLLMQELSSSGARSTQYSHTLILWGILEPRLFLCSKNPDSVALSNPRTWLIFCIYPSPNPWGRPVSCVRHSMASTLLIKTLIFSP